MKLFIFAQKRSTLTVKRTPSIKVLATALKLAWSVFIRSLPCMAKDVKSAQLCFNENVLTAEEGFTAYGWYVSLVTPTLLLYFSNLVLVPTS